MIFLCISLLPTRVYSMWLSFSGFKLFDASDRSIYCKFSCSLLYSPSAQI